MTDAYLAPIKLRTTTLTLIYPTVSMPSWSAGSRGVACSIGASLGNGGWATLVNSAKGPLMINGQPPVPPPDIPQERLTPPPIPTAQVPAPPRNKPSPPRRHDSPLADQHLPGQPATPPPHSSSAGADPVDGHTLRAASPRPLGSGPAGPPPKAPPPAGPPAGPAAGARPPPRRPARRPRRGSSRVAVRMDPQRFDELVSDALDLIPPELTAAIDNVVVLVADRHPDEPDLLGLYEGSR